MGKEYQQETEETGMTYKYMKIQAASQGIQKTKKDILFLLVRLAKIKVQKLSIVWCCGNTQTTGGTVT